MDSLSIYIPQVSAFITVEQIKTQFDHFGIGLVSRVDFIQIGQKQGFLEKNTELVIKSAFVHFNYYYNFESTTNIIRKIGNGESYKVYPSCDRGYWILLLAKKPIQSTLMNRHQIVDNCRFLETKVDEQTKQIADLKTQLENTTSIVRQLLGGLYCQSTQLSPLKDHLAVLSGEKIDESEISYTDRLKFIEELKLKNKWSIWPTTRQGDSNEARIEAMEALLFGEKEPMRFEKRERVIDSNDLQVELDFGV
jgi:hypothetical protein